MGGKITNAGAKVYLVEVGSTKSNVIDLSDMSYKSFSASPISLSTSNGNNSAFVKVSGEVVFVYRTTACVGAIDSEGNLTLTVDNNYGASGNGIYLSIASENLEYEDLSFTAEVDLYAQGVEVTL